MAAQRNHLIGALIRIVSEVDRVGDLAVYLKGLGRDHRKFGAVADHYEAVGTSLLATLEHFAGEAWTPEVREDWGEAYGLIAEVMTAAADEDEQHAPPWWRGTVTLVEQRTYDVTVLYVATDPPMSGYLPGQSVAVETPRRPRLWRYYSMAGPPRGDGILEFHVRLMSGGEVSPVLAGDLGPGDRLRIGPPAGVLTLDTASGRDILMAAGSTGLAPLKAILGQIAMLPAPPAVQLYFGAQRAEGLYELDALEKMAAQCPWLTVTPVVSGEPGYAGETGRMREVIARHGKWQGRDAYLAGPSDMAESTAAYLISCGTPRERVHIEDFGWGDPI
jgi:NAD(P)H-flavin reductase